MPLGPEARHPQLPFNKEDHHVKAITLQVLSEASRKGNNLLETDKRVTGKSQVSAGEGMAPKGSK